MDKKLIGQKMRLVRMEKKFTLATVAEKAKLTKGTLSKIERGEISPPVSTLIRIADALQIKLAELVTEISEPLPRYALTRKNGGVNILDSGHTHSYEALAMTMPSKGAEPFIFTLYPGGPEGKTIKRHRPHSHQGQEFTYMFSGKLEVKVEGESFILKHGDSIYIDASTIHEEHAVGDKPARYLRILIRDTK